MSWKTRRVRSSIFFSVILAGPWVCLAQVGPLVDLPQDSPAEMALELIALPEIGTQTTEVAQTINVRKEAQAIETIEATDLRAKMMHAYQQTETYRATIVQTKSQHHSRWQLVEKLDVVYDRTSHSLRFERPDMLLISSDGYLRYRSDIIQGRHLQIRLNEPLNDGLLAQRAPFLVRQQMPDLKLLLQGDPIDTVGKVTTLEPDEQGRPGLQWASRLGLATLRLDPKTFLITQATLKRQASVERASHVGPVTFSYDITVHKHNEEFDKEWFVFDTSNSQAVNSWTDLLGSNDVDAASLEGTAAPILSLQDSQGELYRLEEDSSDVVVLQFWASWGGPPVYQALPVLQRLSDWASAEDKSLSIRTVNMRETMEEINQVWEIKQLQLPVLLDVEAQGAHAYRVGAIPQTVVIYQGQVVHVHEGMPHEFETVLRAQVSALLETSAVTRK